MRFEDNHVYLTRRERKVLDSPSREVAAEAIGLVWRMAAVRIDSQMERLGPGVSAVIVIPGVGGVASHSSEHYELRRLDKQRQHLGNLEHMVLAIEMETEFPTPSTEVS